jgi:hypothetical protein
MESLMKMNFQDVNKHPPNKMDMFILVLRKPNLLLHCKGQKAWAILHQRGILGIWYGNKKRKENGKSSQNREGNRKRKNLRNALSNHKYLQKIINQNTKKIIKKLFSLIKT